MKALRKIYNILFILLPIFLSIMILSVVGGFLLASWQMFRTGNQIIGYSFGSVAILSALSGIVMEVSLIFIVVNRFIKKKISPEFIEKVKEKQMKNFYSDYDLLKDFMNAIYVFCINKFKIIFSKLPGINSRISAQKI